MMENLKEIDEISKLSNILHGEEIVFHTEYVFPRGYGKQVSNFDRNLRIPEYFHKPAYPLIQRYFARKRLKDLSKYFLDENIRQKADFEVKHSGALYWIHEHPLSLLETFIISSAIVSLGYFLYQKISS